MTPDRMSLAEFAKAVGMSQMSVANALRADHGRPKAERAFPFVIATPPEEKGGKWNYLPNGNELAQFSWEGIPCLSAASS